MRIIYTYVHVFRYVIVCYTAVDAARVQVIIPLFLSIYLARPPFVLDETETGLTKKFDAVGIIISLGPR